MSHFYKGWTIDPFFPEWKYQRPEGIALWWLKQRLKECAGRFFYTGNGECMEGTAWGLGDREDSSIEDGLYRKEWKDMEHVYTVKIYLTWYIFWHGYCGLTVLFLGCYVLCSMYRIVMVQKAVIRSNKERNPISLTWLLSLHIMSSLFPSNVSSVYCSNYLSNPCWLFLINSNLFNCLLFFFLDYIYGTLSIANVKLTGLQLPGCPKPFLNNDVTFTIFPSAGIFLLHGQDCKTMASPSAIYISNSLSNMIQRQYRSSDVHSKNSQCSNISCLSVLTLFIISSISISVNNLLSPTLHQKNIQSPSSF